jgi:hypothetical protein
VKRGLTIVEDDPYGKLRYRGSHVPPIKSFDTTGTVLYLSTFSKIVAPASARVGRWRPARTEKLIVASRRLTSTPSSPRSAHPGTVLRDFDNPAHGAGPRRVRRALRRDGSGPSPPPCLPGTRGPIPTRDVPLGDGARARQHHSARESPGSATSPSCPEKTSSPTMRAKSCNAPQLLHAQPTSS